ncbi:hypothetical protein O9993_05905 [Vibrio lentus]|nr:hypothetical protein [Vibrio lentus]
MGKLVTRFSGIQPVVFSSEETNLGKKANEDASENTNKNSGKRTTLKVLFVDILRWLIWV